VKRASVAALVMLAACGARSSGRAQPEPAANAAETRGPLIIDVDDGVRINGTIVTLPWKRGEAFALLGKPDREEEREGHVLVYEQLGLVLDENLVTGRITAIRVHFHTDELSFIPTKPYSGVLRLRGTTVDGTKSADEIIDSVALPWDSGSYGGLARLKWIKIAVMANGQSRAAPLKVVEISAERE